jgi:hypothetical protein
MCKAQKIVLEREEKKKVGNQRGEVLSQVVILGDQGSGLKGFKILVFIFRHSGHWHVAWEPRWSLMRAVSF